MSILKRTTLLTLITVSFIANKAICQDYSFQDGDRVCFVGNSITMSGSFHHYINLFYTTRFPERKITFFNCGISGEQAGNMLRRIDSDILNNKPTWCVLMVGSNDINEELYSEANKNLPDLEARKREALDKYYENTTLLIESLLAAKTKVILEVPCIYDQTGKLKAENFFGANDALAKCGVFLKQAAEKYGLLLVDYWSITNDINKKVQSKDITATIISGDRTHPNKYGNFLMAYQFLHTQLHSSNLSEITLIRGNRQANKISGSIINDIIETKKSISFNSIEKALPFPIPDEIRVDSLVNFTREFNEETILINGLDKGRYNLLIDSISAGVFTDQQLSKGIDLSGNGNTPQYRQAANVLNLFNEYWKIAADLRAIKYVEYQHLHNLKNKEDIHVVKNFFDSALIKYRSSDNFNFFTNMFNKYLLLKPKEAELQSSLSNIFIKISGVNKPQKHFYKIERVGS